MRDACVHIQNVLRAQNVFQSGIKFSSKTASRVALLQVNRCLNAPIVGGSIFERRSVGESQNLIFAYQYQVGVCLESFGNSFSKIHDGWNCAFKTDCRVFDIRRVNCKQLFCIVWHCRAYKSFRQLSWSDQIQKFLEIFDFGIVSSRASKTITCPNKFYSCFLSCLAVAFGVADIDWLFEMIPLAQKTQVFRLVFFRVAVAFVVADEILDSDFFHREFDVPALAI